LDFERFGMFERMKRGERGFSYETPFDFYGVCTGFMRRVWGVRSGQTGGEYDGDGGGLNDGGYDCDNRNRGGDNCTNVYISGERGYAGIHVHGDSA